jgi:hypothetical protein
MGNTKYQPLTSAQKCETDIDTALATSVTYNALKALPESQVKDLMVGAAKNGVIEGVQSVDPACKGVPPKIPGPKAP